jgi:hypothetical protein
VLFFSLDIRILFVVHGDDDRNSSHERFRLDLNRVLHTGRHKGNPAREITSHFEQLSKSTLFDSSLFYGPNSIISKNFVIFSTICPTSQAKIRILDGNEIVCGKYQKVYFLIVRFADFDSQSFRNSL